MTSNPNHTWNCTIKSRRRMKIRGTWTSSRFRTKAEQRSWYQVVLRVLIGVRMMEDPYSKYKTSMIRDHRGDGRSRRSSSPGTRDWLPSLRRASPGIDSIERPMPPLRWFVRIMLLFRGHLSPPINLTIFPSLKEVVPISKSQACASSKEAERDKPR